MKILFLVSSLAFCVCAHAANEVQLKQQAMKGDYQAMRNLAYSHTNKNPALACTWYRVVILSNSQKINTGDYSNEWTYCHGLTPSESGDSWEQARSLMKQIQK